MSFEVAEGGKSIRLVPEKIYPSKFGVIINEMDVVAIST